MIKKKKKKKAKELSTISLSPTQIAHMVQGAVKNLVDIKVNVDSGLKFLLILNNVAPDQCLPLNQEPETEEDFIDLVASHSIPELAHFIDVILTVKHEDGNNYRAFSTVLLDEENMSEFLEALSELDDYWAFIDQGLEYTDSLGKSTKGKNLVTGNDTIN